MTHALTIQRPGTEISVPHLCSGRFLVLSHKRGLWRVSRAGWTCVTTRVEIPQGKVSTIDTFNRCYLLLFTLTFTFRGKNVHKKVASFEDSASRPPHANNLDVKYILQQKAKKYDSAASLSFLTINLKSSKNFCNKIVFSCFHSCILWRSFLINFNQSKSEYKLKHLSTSLWGTHH